MLTIEPRDTNTEEKIKVSLISCRNFALNRQVYNASGGTCTCRSAATSFGFFYFQCHLVCACARSKLTAYHYALIMRVTLVNVPNTHVYLYPAYGSEIYSPCYI